MAKEFAIKFYRSKAWQVCRQLYIKSVHGLCERCDSAGYIVHHKITLTPDNITDLDIFLNHKNLEYLCIDCHNREHMGSKEEVMRDGLMFDVNGDVVERG